METPGAEHARAVAAAYSGRGVAGVRRFPEGLCHFVFEVVLEDGALLVVRLARPENERLLAGAVFWEERLRTAGVPVARILEADLEKRRCPFAYLILERLEGADLGEVYPELTAGGKVVLAGRMAALQRAVATLPLCRMYGDAPSYAEPGAHGSWESVVAANIATCRGRVQGNPLLRGADIDRLDAAAAALKADFAGVEARAFLDDATTKNVIVTADGRLSGIVDVDTVCFGDPLFALALTRAAFAKLGYDSVYTDVWAEALGLGAKGRRRLSFYTALFAAILLSEHGLRFNRDTDVEIERGGVGRLRAIFDGELGRS